MTPAPTTGNHFFPTTVSFNHKISNDCREHVQRALAVYSFLIRLYNLPEDEFQVVLQELEVRGLTLEGLHDTFYLEFMYGFCYR